MNKYQLNDQVFVIQERSTLTNPCSHCKSQQFRTVFEVKEVKVSDILSHTKSYGQQELKYRVRTLDDLINLDEVYWREEQFLFPTYELAMQHLIKVQKQLNKEETNAPAE